MPKVRILTEDKKRWGEGWQYGDVVELDMVAAQAALEKGELEIVDEEVKKPKKVAKKTAKKDGEKTSTTK